VYRKASHIYFLKQAFLVLNRSKIVHIMTKIIIISSSSSSSSSSSGGGSSRGVVVVVVVVAGAAAGEFSRQIP
jgi:membrane protein involved in colicin uptake